MLGVAFDAGQILSQSERARLRRTAINSGVWSYIEPASLTPTWVHFDKRFGRPACGGTGYPALRRGSISTYVLIAQDDLNTLGFRTGGLDRNIWKSDRTGSKKLSTLTRIISRRYCRM